MSDTSSPLPTNDLAFWALEKREACKLQVGDVLMTEKIATHVERGGRLGGSASPRIPSVSSVSVGPSETTLVIEFTSWQDNDVADILRGKVVFANSQEIHIMVPIDVRPTDILFGGRSGGVA